MKITRRQFLQYCTASAAALGLSQTDLLELEKALAADVCGCEDMGSHMSSGCRTVLRWLDIEHPESNANRLSARRRVALRFKLDVDAHAAGRNHFGSRRPDSGIVDLLVGNAVGLRGSPGQEER